MTDPHQLLQHLVEQLMLLPDADQQFVLGCQANVEVVNIPLTPEQVKRLHAIAASLQQLEHSTLALGAPLSMPKVLKDLASAVHMLSKEEHAYALKCSRHIAKGGQLAPDEINKLLAIHAAKGF